MDLHTNEERAIRKAREQVHKNDPQKGEGTINVDIMFALSKDTIC